MQEILQKIDFLRGIRYFGKWGRISYKFLTIFPESGGKRGKAFTSAAEGDKVRKKGHRQRGVVGWNGWVHWFSLPAFVSWRF